MIKKNKKARNSAILSASDIAKTYHDLKLSYMLTMPYDRNAQQNVFRKVSIYTDDRPCYASSNTKPYSGDF